MSAIAHGLVEEALTLRPFALERAIGSCGATALQRVPRCLSLLLRLCFGFVLLQHDGSG